MPTSILSNLYAPCPPAGEGCHQWLYGAACTLLEIFPDISDDVAAVHMSAAVNRPLQPREAVDAMTAARAAAGRPSSPWRPKPAPQPFDADRLLVAPPPVLVPPEGGTTARLIVRKLICGGDPGGLVCIARTASTAQTRALSEFSDAELTAQYIVPRMMSARQGLTKDGRPSARCHGNAGDRLFWVYDFDGAIVRGGTYAQAAAILERFGDRVALIVATRGKGIHAYVRATADDVEDDMVGICYRLGADPTVLNDKCKLTRMPWGVRPSAAGGLTQHVIHLTY